VYTSGSRDRAGTSLIDIIKPCSLIGPFQKHSKSVDFGVKKGKGYKYNEETARSSFYRVQYHFLLFFVIANYFLGITRLV